MSSSEASWPIRMLKGFAMFWWDFLIGDTPELFVGALVVLGAVALLSISVGANAAAVVLAPTLVIVLLIGTVVRAVRQARPR